MRSFSARGVGTDGAGENGCGEPVRPPRRRTRQLTNAVTCVTSMVTVCHASAREANAAPGQD